MVVMAIEHTNVDPKLLLNTQCLGSPLGIVLVIALKLEFVNNMSKVVNGTVLQIRDEFLDMKSVVLEALTKAEYQT